MGNILVDQLTIRGSAGMMVKMEECLARCLSARLPLAGRGLHFMKYAQRSQIM